jgi:tRNA (guanine-N7-)-methyltransferase
MPRVHMSALPEPSPRRYGELAPKPPEGPIDLSTLWTQQHGEIEVEIGFGRGMFLLERAQAAPGARLLGIEVKTKWAYLVSERAKGLGLAGVRVFGSDARDVLPRLRPLGSVARVLMHFPDPWWKKRHAKRRLRGRDTLDPIAALLAPGGEIFVQTDVEDRAQDFVNDLRAHEAFDVPEVPFLLDHAYNARSNREKRAIADGLPIYRVIAHRRSGSAPAAW